MGIEDIVKVMVPATLAFWFGIMGTPILTHYLYKYKAWKKTPGKTAYDGTEASVFNSLHGERETKTPRMGGIVIWGAAAATILTLWLVARFYPTEAFSKLDFLSRSQTWVPFFALLFGAVVGLLNDIRDVTGKSGLPVMFRIGLVAAMACFVGVWFHVKLDVVAIGVPFMPDIFVGWLVVPFFVLIALALYASGVIDGIDGLSGGVFASIFAAYAGIAFFQSQIDLAAFCATIVGAILAFLWFNIPPARFWMTETGSMALTLALAVVVFMTDALGEGEGVFVLPIIALPLVVTVGSVILQLVWKKVYGRKLFLVAPLHHHFEAIGWPGYKVTMRYWVLSVVCAIVGVIIALVG